MTCLKLFKNMKEKSKALRVRINALAGQLVKILRTFTGTLENISNKTKWIN